jgi:hypothetical protein
VTPVARPALALALIALAVLGCGKKGPPVAPERRLPNAPAGLQAVIEGSTVVVTWTNPTQRFDGTRLRDLATLRLYRREESGTGEPKPAMLSGSRVVGYDEMATIRLEAPAPAVVQGHTVRWVDAKGLVPGHRYVYVVTAIDATDRSSAPSPRLVVDFIAAPGSPHDVKATAGDAKVEISWQPPAALIDGTAATPGEMRYVVLRGGEGEGPLAPVTPAPIAATTFTDSGLANDTTYRYAVRATRTVPPSTVAAFGDASTAVAATPVDTTPPAPPAALLAVPGPAAVRLAWTPSPDADVALYAVYRAEGRGGFVRIGTTAPPSTAYVDRDVTAGTTYRYAVTALDRARTPNESARSNEVTVRAE